METVELDLLAEGAVDELALRIQELDIGLVVLSAGVFTTGPFTGKELRSETELVTLMPCHSWDRTGPDRACPA